MKPNLDSHLNRSYPKFLLTRKLTIPILRSSPGEYIEGHWVPGEVTEITIEANVQPMRGWELQALPESDRSKESIKVYTESTLKTVEEVGATMADIAVWGGKKFQVIRAVTYRMGILDHTKAICYRLPETPDDLASYEEQTPP